MTFEQYIQNPMGKENAVFSQRQMYMQMYSSKFDAVLAREAGDIKYRMYKDTDARYLLHIRIPSEVVEKFYYDVVIEFYTKDKSIKAENTLSHYDIRFFSNDPAFCFTFAYAFKKNGMFIKDLELKIPSQIIQQKAEVKNPRNIVGYVKSIFFAYLYMKLRGLFSKTEWKYGSVKYDKFVILKDIEFAGTKIQQRQDKGKLVARKKKIHQDNLAVNPASSAEAERHRLEVQNSKRVSKTQVINKSHYMKHATHTKHTKKIR